ncbi:hypothetical protein TTHERM_000609359 (macronuclear) [Tetrahymena thermophila SB210]|uniref:Uncharacterized protein n=1 Tax=Tetrahymena thermophila (strain SB210) TaxID=312017 RepID=W7X8X4_TETTS|nr:hypothetical protein TTHERM_000609359 [Tetrahymena thermophila SB210]EWS75825.1 hypothetical protein TTHERM_000609359 [Tetrahymena thermophila SB210]|eukprot:XP_012651639.1 hypothetical protein TTHERM_000609359 [Tetrahymena thermophila SB210]
MNIAKKFQKLSESNLCVFQSQGTLRCLVYQKFLHFMNCGTSVSLKKFKLKRNYQNSTNMQKIIALLLIMESNQISNKNRILIFCFKNQMVQINKIQNYLKTIR